VSHDVDLAAQRDEQPLAQDVQLADTVDALEQDGELVTAQPGTESTARTQATSRAATILSSSSPSAWPNRSLTPLNPSRSRNSTARVVSLRRARITPCSTRSRNRVRFGNDVRAS